MNEDIYNVSKYTDNELYQILDLVNPSDRELEAKIIYFLNKYSSIQNKSGKQLYDFFNDIYNHFFDEDDEDLLFEEDSEVGDTLIDEDQLISFLNEYYTVNPNRLPKAEIY